MGMGILESLLQVAATAVGTLIVQAVDTTLKIASDIRTVYLEFRARKREVDSHFEKRQREEKKRREQEMHDINSEIVDFEEKCYRDGNLNEYDEVRLNDLYQRRDSKIIELSKVNEILIADRVYHGGDDYGSIIVSDPNTHILQFHVGQTVFGKRCSRCNRSMVLQWQRGLDVVSMRDFFWGCAGWYGGQCRNTEHFMHSDMGLFTNTNREAFSLDTETFTSLVLKPGPSQYVQKKMNEIEGEENDTYYCPEHYEPMVLRQKNDPQGLLDMYFYGCPRWNPKGPPTCRQIVKLKSAAQLAAALETQTGQGIL